MRYAPGAGVKGGTRMVTANTAVIAATFETYRQGRTSKCLRLNRRR